MPQVAMSAVMLIASAATTTMSMISANQQADAQEQAAKNAAAADYNQEVLQQDQVDQQAAIDKSERARQAMMERASLRVAQGESGVSGISPIREQGAIDFNQTFSTSIIEANRSNTIRQIEAEKNKTYANAQSRINVAGAGKSSGWAAGLQIGSAAVSGAASGYSMGKSWFDGGKK